MRRVLSVAGMSALLFAAAPVSAQQPPVEVERLESLRTMVPVPKVGEGAPYYSTEQLEAERKQASRNIGCIGADARRRSFNNGYYGRNLLGYGGSYRQRSFRHSAFNRQAEESRIVFHARKAANATTAAEDARKKAAQGLVGAAEVERTELLRQAAVRYYDKLLGRDFGLGYDPLVGLNPSVEIEVVSATIREQNGREMLFVSGRLHNQRSWRTTIPAVTLAVYDLDGNLTMATAAQPSARGLGAGETQPFTLSVPAWKDAARVEVRPGMLAPFLGDRDFCRPHNGLNALQAANVYELLQDDLRFNLAPGVTRGGNSAAISRMR